MKRLSLACPLVLLLAGGLAAEDKPAKNPKEALQAFNNLIGSWRATGEPNGTREEKQKGFWTETIKWEWQFKGGEAWLKASFDKGKHFATAELRPLAKADTYRLTLTTLDKEVLQFEGTLDKKRLTLQRTDPKTKQVQRLVLSFLHENRYLYRYEVKGADQTSFVALYQVGATKEGVPFAGKGDDRPECIISGGLGTIPVTYKGKTYYVCCSGCRDEFNDNPEKYVKEYEAKKAKKDK